MKYITDKLVVIKDDGVEMGDIEYCDGEYLFHPDEELLTIEEVEGILKKMKSLQKEV